MNKLISIIGPSGTGKTTLVKSLASTNLFETAMEDHSERPYQQLAKQDSIYMFANQIDYLLLRSEQEQAIRKKSKIGLVDGGLDLDFHGFTRLFLHRNMISQNEFDVCHRLYVFTRSILPYPELFVRLRTGRETISSRLSKRRRINIADATDHEQFDIFLDEWIQSQPSLWVLELDVTQEDIHYKKSVGIILDTINRIP